MERMHRSQSKVKDKVREKSITFLCAHTNLIITDFHIVNISITYNNVVKIICYRLAISNQVLQ